jgi:hypothetical protein
MKCRLHHHSFFVLPSFIFCSFFVNDMVCCGLLVAIVLCCFCFCAPPPLSLLSPSSTPRPPVLFT